MTQKAKLYVTSENDKKVENALREAGLDLDVVNANRFRHGELFRDFRTSRTPILVLSAANDEIVVVGTQQIFTKAREIIQRREARAYSP